MRATWLCVVIVGAVGCREADDPALPDTDVDVSDLLVNPPACVAVHDRPPADGEPWVFSGPDEADVVWGFRPAATWDGEAAVLVLGPGTGCEYGCAFSGGGFGGRLTYASELAVELELGCAAEIDPYGLPQWAYAGLRLRLQGPVQRLPDGSEGPLEITDLPLHLPDPAASPCVADSSDAGSVTSSLRRDAKALEPGRFLPWRIPLGPLVHDAGYDPRTTLISWYHLVLEGQTRESATAWVEVGRSLMDACP